MVALRRFTASLAALGGLSLTPTIYASNTSYISGIGLDGVTRQLASDRTPALYTGDFGDCLGGESLLNVTKFDAAFYWDNSTILFHLDGATNLQSEDLICKWTQLHILVRELKLTRCQYTSRSRHTASPGIPKPWTRAW
jgi:hypothetical protein